MFINTLDKKPIIKKSDGNSIRDLTKSMFDFEKQNYVTYTAYKVPKEYVMRPDLISQAVYNNTIYTEIILKYNGISNPFSINQDDIILIPGLDTVKNNIKKRSDSNVNDLTDQLRKTYKYIDPTKNPVRDENIAKFDGRNLQDGALPPNIAPEGSDQIAIRNGRVYFGEGIGTSACLKNGMTNSEFLTKVIKSRQTLETPILETTAQANARIKKEGTLAVTNKPDRTILGGAVSVKPADTQNVTQNSKKTIRSNSTITKFD